MADALQMRQRASEEAFFKQAQEEFAMRWLEKLKTEGRLDHVKMPKAVAPSAGVLPQVLAHTLRTAPHKKAVVNAVVLEHNFQPGKRPRFLPPAPCKITSSMQLGGRVDMGRTKWVSNQVEGASLFSLSDGYRLAEGNGVQVKQRTLPTASELVQIGGKSYKLLPDYTPGRALFWGSALALWASCAGTMHVAKRMGINTVEDVKPVLTGMIAPLVGDASSGGIKRQAKELSSQAAELKTSSFIKGLRNVMA